MEELMKCAKCGRMLPISCYPVDRSYKSGHKNYCRQCKRAYENAYYKDTKIRDAEKRRERSRIYKSKNINTFGRMVDNVKGSRRGKGGILKRDYELTEEQRERRETARRNREKMLGHEQKYKRAESAIGVMVWYDGKLNDADAKTYIKMLSREYQIQKLCAVRGCKARKKEVSTHFLFDFDLEEMLKRDITVSNIKIEKWWDGEIRHWTVNDGIWRKGHEDNKGL